jgi:SNARE protein
MSKLSGGMSRDESQRVYEQEVQLNALFDELSEGFKKLDELNDTKKQAELKRMTGIMSEAKALIRSFEQEAKLDNMPADDINYRKKLLVQELNSFIGLKKAYSSQLQQRKDLLEGKSTPTSMQATGPTVDEVKEMRTQELVELGRNHIGETDESLLRSERLVNDTIAIGAQTAETLQQQGNQLSKISEDLDEIHFSNEKARKVIRDITRGLATDRCIQFFLLLVVIAIVVLVVLKVTGVGDVNI